METIKFFILGISGNLAKEKVLPALGQFHGVYGDQINIEIHGCEHSRVGEVGQPAVGGLRLRSASL